jgi:hypothetical protein
MAAHESLNPDQFEEVHKNRTMRIGERNYPAVWTGSHSTGGYGIIPMESGHIAHIEFNAEPFDEHPAGWRILAGGEARVHKTQDPQAVHTRLEQLATTPPTPQQRESNQDVIRQHLEWNRQGL